MSLLSSCRERCAVYRLSLGDSYPRTETWSAIGEDVPCLRAVSDRREQLEDGTLRTVSVERIRMEPRDVTAKDRILLNETVYAIEGEPEDVQDLGREMIMRVRKLPDGTAAEMGIA
jgi:hypothetical protein